MSGPARFLLILVMIGGVALVAGGMIVLLKGEEEVAPPSPDATDTTARPDTTPPRTQPETHRPSGGPPIMNTQNPPHIIRRDPQLSPRYGPGRSQDRSRSKVRAIVRDQDGKSIEGAEIYVSSSLTPSTAEQNILFRRIAAGIYESRGGLVEGHYYIRCRAKVHSELKNFAIATAEADVGYGQVKVATFTLPTRGRLSVSGSITTGSGAAGGIDVILRSDTFEAHATSAADGSYRVEKLPAGTYKFRALYRDPLSKATSDLFSAELNLQMDMAYSPRLDMGTLELTIAPRSGVDVARLRVEFLRADTTNGEESAVYTSVASGVTDQRGVLKIKYVPKGLFKVVIAGLVAEPDQLSLPTVRTISARKPRAPGE